VVIVQVRGQVGLPMLKSQLVMTWVSGIAALMAPEKRTKPYSRPGGGKPQRQGTPQAHLQEGLNT